MEEQEITLDELVERTVFTKRQIYNWQKAGLCQNQLGGKEQAGLRAR